MPGHLKDPYSQKPAKLLGSKESGRRWWWQQQQQQQQQLYEHLLIQMPHFHDVASGFKSPYSLLTGFSSKDKFLWFVWAQNTATQCKDMLEA
jgi:hypothetical protein